MLKSKEYTAAVTVTYDGIHDFLVDMIKQLENADDHVKKAIASQFIDKITINSDDINVRLTVSPFRLSDKINNGWAMFSLTAKRTRNKWYGYTTLEY